jgi:hypothetical protein
MNVKPKELPAKAQCRGEIAETDANIAKRRARHVGIFHTRRMSMPGGGRNVTGVTLTG